MAFSFALVASERRRTANTGTEVFTETMEGSCNVPHILSFKAYADIHRSWVVVRMWVAGFIDVDEQWEPLF